MAANIKIRGNFTETQAKEAIKKGQPPEANKKILVDFDGTLYKFGYLFSAPPPIEGAVEFMQELKARGYTIGIFTSRLSDQWLKRAGNTAAQHVAYITAICKRDKIPFDFITAEKLPAEAYIDDKAIPFRDNWKEIYEQFFGRD